MKKQSIHWKIRVDNLTEDDNVLLKLMAFCEERKELCDLIIGVKEISDVVKKLHYHVVFHYKEPITYYAMKKSVDRAFPDIKGSAKSVAKVKKVQTNLFYHCKGGKYFFLHGINKEQCDKLGSEWVDKKKPKKAKTHYETIKGMLRTDRGYNKIELATVVYYYFIGRPMNHVYMKHIVNGLYSEINKDDGLERFLDTLGIFPENKISVDNIVQDLICQDESIANEENVEHIEEGVSHDIK